MSPNYEFEKCVHESQLKVWVSQKHGRKEREKEIGKKDRRKKEEK